MRKVFFIFLFLLFCSFANGQVLTDAQFFNVLNLDYPGVEKVKSCVSRKDYAAAKKAFVSHLKTRTSPKWYIDWHDFKQPVHILRNLALPCGRLVKYLRKCVVDLLQHKLNKCI